MVVQLIGICQEAHVFDCIFCLLSVFPCDLVRNVQVVVAGTAHLSNEQQDEDQRPSPAAIYIRGR